MKIKISEIAPYGRFYSDIFNHVEWWFCVQDFKVYSFEEVSDKFGYLSKQKIIDSNQFIQLFRTDIIQLEKEYLETIKVYYKKGLLPFEKSKTFDKDFKIFVEENFLTSDWYQFERENLINDTIEWCKINRIPYIADL